MAELGCRFVIDGEIAAPDERGVTHLDDLPVAIANRQPECLAYFGLICCISTVTAHIVERKIAMVGNGPPGNGSDVATLRT